MNFGFNSCCCPCVRQPSPLCGASGSSLNQLRKSPNSLQTNFTRTPNVVCGVPLCWCRTWGEHCDASAFQGGNTHVEVFCVLHLQILGFPIPSHCRSVLLRIVVKNGRNMWACVVALKYRQIALERFSRSHQHDSFRGICVAWTDISRRTFLHPMLRDLILSQCDPSCTHRLSFTLFHRRTWCVPLRHVEFF